MSLYSRITCLASVLVVLAGGASAACREDHVEIRGDFGTARFSVEIADDPQERAIGLMNRPSMAHSAGMLFIYERPQMVSFWMENTLIPLDMLFIDESGVIARIHENAIPLDRTPIPGTPETLAVLEINGGLARDIGISEGDLLRNPLLPQELAAWSCEVE